MPVTRFDDDDTGGLGVLTVEHPPGAFTPTTATRLALQSVGVHRARLHGVGLDWGCGVGILAIAAARIDAVDFVIGLDIEPVNVDSARANAAANDVDRKTRFVAADSLRPIDPADARLLDALSGSIFFVLANPPASSGDDGFGYRRRVLEDCSRVLAMGGVVFLNISAQYGRARVAELADPGGSYRHAGVLGSTDPVPFDLRRQDLLRNLDDYVIEEQRGGHQYEFIGARGPMSASEALAAHRRTGASPLTRWQVHLFVRE